MPASAPPRRRDDRQAHAQRHEGKQGEQAHSQDIDRRDHRTDMQAADRKQMRQPGIAHRVLVGRRDAAPIAACQCGRDRTGRSGETGANVIGQVLLPAAQQPSPVRRGQHIDRPDHAAGRGKALEPRGPCEVVSARQHRRSGRHQARPQPHRGAFGKTGPVLFQRQVHAHPHRTGYAFDPRVDEEAHPPPRTFLLPVENAPLHPAEGRMVHPRLSDERGLAPHRHATCRHHERQRKRGKPNVIQRTLARDRQGQRRHRRTGGEKRHPLPWPVQFQPACDSRQERDRKPWRTVERAGGEECVARRKYAGQAPIIGPMPRRFHRQIHRRFSLSFDCGHGRHGMQ